MIGEFFQVFFLQVEEIMLEFFGEIFPIKAELFFSMFLVIDSYFLLVASIKENLMPKYSYKSFTKLIFGLEMLDFLTTLMNGFTIFLHIFNWVELFNILPTVHQ